MVFGEVPVVSSSKGAGPAHRTPGRLHQAPKSKARERKEETWKSTILYSKYLARGTLAGCSGSSLLS